MAGRRKNNKHQKPVKEVKHRVNDEIFAPEVRVVGVGDEPKIFLTAKAIQMAESEGLDLVEVSPNAEPPVCKIMDYGKFLYDQKKKKKEFSTKNQKVVIKEIRFGPNTDQHDFNFKAKNARKFLEEGSKVRAYVFFKGRTIRFKDKGVEILEKLIEELSDVGKLETDPKIEGKKMIIILSPSKPKK